jgi:hypothetical protein
MEETLYILKISPNPVTFTQDQETYHLNSQSSITTKILMQGYPCIGVLPETATYTYGIMYANQDLSQAPSKLQVPERHRIMNTHTMHTVWCNNEAFSTTLLISHRTYLQDITSTRPVYPPILAYSVKFSETEKHAHLHYLKLCMVTL